jgi:FdhD protein
MLKWGCQGEWFFWENQVEDKTANALHGIAPEIEGFQFSDGNWETRRLSLPQEMPFTLYLNSQELVTILCSPNKLNCLTLGYLAAEGIIRGIKDVAAMRVCEDDSLADVKLSRSDFVLPQKRVLTSGCGGGVSLNAADVGPRLESDLKTSPERMLSLMREMLSNAALYNLSGGIHTSALADLNRIEVLGEDIGRHNTLDKILGECLLREISTRDKILITSGRISSEMLRKAARMGTPIVASLTSPTERAVLLARELEICLAGYARGSHLTVYSKPDRLGYPASIQQTKRA